MLCGAMLVVENICAAYNGFTYYTMDMPAADLRWTQHIADHNFMLCRERLTIPHAILNMELSLLSHGGGGHN
jgi:hypothetical protein